MQIGKRLLGSMCALALAWFLLGIGLVAHARRADSVAGLWHFDEGSGGNVYDSSGNNNTGSLTGAADFNTNFKFGHPQSADAVAFDGSTGYIDVPDSSSLRITGSLSIDAWIYLPADPISFHVIAAKWGNALSGTGGYFLALDGNKLFAETSPDGTNVIDVAGGTAVSSGAWHHVALVVDTTAHTETLYLDGIQDGQTTDSTLTGVHSNNIPLTMGAYSTDGGSSYTGFFDGEIDEVHIWARALGSDEIAFLYNVNTRGELFVPDQASQVLGPGAVFSSAWHVGDTPPSSNVIALAFIVPDDAGTTIASIAEAKKYSTPGPGANLAGSQTCVGSLAALIGAYRSLTVANTLHLVTTLSDGTNLGMNIQWSAP